MCFLCASSCDDVLETNIRDKQIVMRTPVDSSSMVAGNITFWWEKLSGARSYQLLIVSPDNLHPTTLVLDSVITTNQFSMELSEGKYQWCVKGMNDGYQTALICRSLEITN